MQENIGPIQLRVIRKRAAALVLAAGWLLLAQPIGHVVAADQTSAVADPLSLYANARGIDLAQASWELGIEDLAGEAEPLMAQAMGSSFAGLFIERSPVMRIIVLSTESSDSDAASKVAVEVGLGSNWTFKTAKYSVARLQGDALDLSRKVAGRADVWWDVVQNSVEVRALPNEGLSNLLPVTAHLAEVPVLAGPTTAIKGGMQISGCSVGFTIKQGATNGIVTAGHCSDTQQFNGVNLPFVGEHNAGSVDAQWHTAPGLSTPNHVYLKDLDAYLIITSRTGISGQAIGSTFCKSGWTTGFDCGTLDNKGFCATWVPNWNCTYGMGSHDGLDMTSPGDSGGSVWRSASAWGIISGETWNIHTFCTCNVVYTPVNYFEAEMGVVVKTAP